MESPDRWLYEYCIVRYLPNAERGEFVNIGLLMLCKRQKWMKGKIYLDPEKLRRLDPHVDLEALQGQANLFENMKVPGVELPAEERFRWLAAEKSACLRVSPAHPGLISCGDEKINREDEEILEKEFQRLFHQLVL